MKKLAVLVLVLVAAAALASADYFEKGKFTVGPTIGYAAWGSLSFGATGEYGITEKIGIGGDLAYTTWTSDKYTISWYTGNWPNYTWTNYTYDYKYTLIGILASGSYHFKPAEKFDPWVKLGLGYFSISEKDEWEPSTPSGTLTGLTSATASGIGIDGQLGMHYWTSPKMAIRASIGYPNYFAAGLDFKF